jgi:hypothetical protein
MRAMGKPVAFDASADDRDTRGFISTTIISPSAGFTANWMLQPPASTPISRMMAMAASRMPGTRRPTSVCTGATVMESPVCTPMGSMFSMEQTMTTLSRAVAHDLELELLPADHRPVDQHLADRRQLDATADRLLELVAVVGDAAAVPPSVNDGRMIAG